MVKPMTAHFESTNKSPVFARLPHAFVRSCAGLKAEGDKRGLHALHFEISTMKEAFILGLLILCAFLPNTVCSTDPAAADPSVPSSADTASQEPTDVQAVRKTLLNLGFKKESIELAPDTTVKEYGRLQDLFELEKYGRTILHSLKWKIVQVNVPLSGLASAHCELAWFLDVVSFDDAVDCLRRSNRNDLEADEALLINVFADRHAFELSSLLREKNIDLGDEAMLLSTFGAFCRWRAAGIRRLSRSCSSSTPLSSWPSAQRQSEKTCCDT